MSETAKNDDIEDVLSSIRRLVSDSAGLDRAVAQPHSVERLVLTPALRVAEAEGVFSQVQPVAEQGEHAPESSDETCVEPAPEHEPEPQGATFARDETSPERTIDGMAAPEPTIDEMADDTAGGQAEAEEALPPRRELPFGLSSFTRGAVFGSNDTRDVLLFRGAEGGSDASEAEDETPIEATGVTNGASPDEAAAEEMGWPEPDASLDAAEWPDETAEDRVEQGTPVLEPAEEEPVDVMPVADELSEPVFVPEGSQQDVQGEQRTVDADQQAWDAARAAVEAAQQDAAAPEEASGASADEDAVNTLDQVAQQEDDTDDPAAQEELAAVREESIEPAAAQEDAAGPTLPQGPVGDAIDPVADDTDDPEVEFATLSHPDLARLDIPIEPAFEPEHGDTDWSETESVQPALDIAAVRHARGEAPLPQSYEEAESAEAAEVRTTEQVDGDAHSEADMAPRAIPVFARSRRRAMTSLDDLITPEGSEPDTVADAVSQAMADNALERQEAAAEPAVNAIADESFDVDADAGDDLGLIDEEALRDLIAQVVREELQGVLGQRITRNVRKMVRREIRLALAAEEFD